MSALILQEHQHEHFSRILSILSEHRYYMDFSRMGTGKTYVCGKVAEIMELPLFIVCPISAMSAWEKMSKDYGIPVVTMISYQSLRGTDKYPPKHGYLNRWFEMKPDSKGNLYKKTMFEPSMQFLDLVKSGILLVFDEGQSIKNDSDQGKAARTLSRAICGRSRCAFISGSPYDKEEHSENILRFLSILGSKHLIWSNPRTGEKVPKGLLDVINYCNDIDPDRTQEVLAEYPEFNTMNAGKARSLCHHLFRTIVKDTLASEMEVNASAYAHPLHMEESYLCMEEDELAKLEKGISDLASATRFNGRDVDPEKIEWGAVTLALKNIEISMLRSMTDMAKKILKEKAGSKVVLAVSFLDSISYLMEHLREYSPCYIDGTVKSQDRNKRVNTFNSDASCRVLISTIKTGGVSISLHDTVGDSPRHMLLIPTYSIVDIYQASGRIHRTGIKSDAYFYILYGTNAETPTMPVCTVKVTPILNALTRKKDVLKALITKQAEVYKLPGEFPTKVYGLEEGKA